MNGHDDLCPSAVVCDEGDGWLCDLVTRALRDGVLLAIATVDTGGRAAKQLEELLATLDGVRA